MNISIKLLISIIILSFLIFSCSTRSYNNGNIHVDNKEITSSDNNDNVYVINEIPENIYGVYLSEAYLNYVEIFRSSIQAINKCYNKNFIIIIKNSKILGINNYHDGYSVSLQKYQGYDISDIENNIIRTDEGERMIRISKDIEYEEDVLRELVMPIIWKEKIYRSDDNNKIEIIDSEMYCNGVNYKLIFDPVFSLSDCDLYRSSTNDFIGINIAQNGVIVFKPKSYNENDPGFNSLKEILFIVK